MKLFDCRSARLVGARRKFVTSAFAGVQVTDAVRHTVENGIQMTITPV